MSIHGEPLRVDRRDLKVGDRCYDYANPLIRTLFVVIENTDKGLVLQPIEGDCHYVMNEDGTATFNVKGISLYKA